MLVSEDDLFGSWAPATPTSEAPDTHRPRASLDSVPFMHTVYWGAYRRGHLRDRDGEQCRAYAVEERSAGQGRRVPARYGIRFPDDDSYWMVPANEIVLAQTHSPGAPPVGS
jgi:hypothetical protein